VVLNAKWVGIDFGQTFMDPSPVRTYWIIGDISKQLGEPELVEERCQRWRVMKEKYGSYPVLHERARPEILRYVLDDRPGAGEVLLDIEQNYLTVANGAMDAIKYLKDEGIEISIVAELKRTLGPISADIVGKFLLKHKLLEYFSELITPQGKVNLSDGSVDLSYRGSSKEEGTLYDVLAKDLLKRGIKTSEAVMVGDKEWSDITPAQKRGFQTVHYMGYIFHAPSDASFKIRHFSELKKIIKGVT
jgi:FMN phosphatase YigB (HAD superfamily)